MSCVVFVVYKNKHTKQYNAHDLQWTTKTFIIIYCYFCLQQIINPHERQQTNEKVQANYIP